MTVKNKETIIYSEFKDKPIVYISSMLNNKKSSSFDFFVEIITCISEKLSLDYDLIVKIPSSSHPSQVQLLEKILSQSESYGLFIIAPLKTIDVKNVIISKGISTPIITIDKFIEPFNLGESRIEIPFISSDWKEGGKHAADIFIEYFTLQDKVNILILEGLEGSQSRIDGFTQRIKETNKNECKKRKEPCIKCITNENCKFSLVKSKKLDFTRETAKTYVKRFLQDSNSIDGIFACNDEMALGARDALLDLTQTNKKYKIKIVGFDGINEVKSILQNIEEDFLLGTIDVNVVKQVEHLISSITSNSIQNKKEFVKCEPKIIIKKNGKKD
jgi:ABC-type sugar transport system substrate-binding protein